MPVATAAELDVGVFRLERGRAALEKYAAVSHLTVQVYGPDGNLAGSPVHRTPLFDLFAGGRDLRLLDECARHCLDRADPLAPVVLEERRGIAVVGSTLVLAGAVVGAAVAGYALTTHPATRDVRRLAQECELPFDAVWAVVRKQLPVPRARLPLLGELLGILGNTLVSEHARARQLEETSLRLAQASEAKDRFLAVLSHELRTPLTAVLGYARLLRQGRLPGREDHALEVIERNAKLQAQLIEDLLDMSRIIAGKVRIDAALLGLAQVVETAVENIRPASQAKGIRLDLELDASAGMVSGDPVRLQQIVSNLLSNAIKFTPSGGAVRLSLARHGREVRLTVTDTGAGIRPGFLPHVFDAFQQDDATEARGQGGLGLGLAIVRHLVQLHDGSLRAESPGEGRGTTFTVSLPAYAGPEAVPLDSRSPAAGIPDAVASPPALEGVRVLLVDDDPDARELLTRVLEDCKADVRAVASAAAALDTLERWKPDVLVSDIGMPGQSGHDLIRSIRGLTRARGGAIPALAVTAYGGTDDAARALAAGFQQHVPKPVDPVDLAGAVAALARHARGLPPVVGDDPGVTSAVAPPSRA